MNEEIRQKMLAVLPHLRFAIEEATAANNTAVIHIGILTKNADGSGKVLSSFRAEEFIEDLAKLLDAGPLTDDQRMDARALKFLTEFGL